MAKLTAQEFYSKARKFNPGEYVYINAATLDEEATESLKKMIEFGYLTPDDSIVVGLFANSDDIMAGRKIISSMDYLVGTVNFNNMLNDISRQQENK